MFSTYHNFFLKIRQHHKRDLTLSGALISGSGGAPDASGALLVPLPWPPSWRGRAEVAQVCSNNTHKSTRLMQHWPCQGWGRCWCQEGRESRDWPQWRESSWPPPSPSIRLSFQPLVEMGKIIMWSHETATTITPCGLFLEAMRSNRCSSCCTASLHRRQ